jgi:hypothetical protein
LTSTERISSVFSPGAGLDREVETLAGLQLDGRREVAGADFRALDVHHDRDLAAARLTVRMRRMMVRVQSCLAWAMLRRTTSAPAR